MNPLLKPLRMASWLEGTTLLALLLVAVPLKRLYGVPDAVTVIGPIHGIAFVVYLLMVLHALWMRWLQARSALLLFVAALIPLGAFFAGPLFARRSTLKPQTNPFD